MPRSARRQEQQRISLVDFIPLFGFAEQLGCISKLRLKRIFDLRPNLITAISDSRTNRRSQLRRIAPEMFAHFPDAFLDNALHCSAPSGVKDSDRTMLGIDHDHRQTIRREHRKQQPASVGNQAVPGQRMFGSLRNTIDKIGMNLAQIREFPRAIASLCYCCNQCSAIFSNGRPHVVNGETEIQAAFAVRP